MSPTRRNVLLAAPLLWALPRAAFAASRRRLVVMVADGGWDMTLCMDPKPGAAGVEGPEVDEDVDDPEDREAIQTFAGIPVWVNDTKRPAVRTFFEAWAPSLTVVNGIWVGSIAHDPCRRRMLTGHESTGRSDLTVLAGARHGADLPVGSFDCAGLGSLGPLAATTGGLGRTGQVAGLLDPSLRFPAALGATTDPRGDLPTAAAPAVEAWLANRRAAYRLTHADPRAHLDALDESVVRARRLIDEAADLTSLVVPGHEPRMDDAVDIAVGLLERDIAAAVLLQANGAWDTHVANVNQHGLYDNLFAGLTRLVEGLSGAGLLDDTLVLVTSEMGRTPARNEVSGKDHWGHTSALLIGGGLPGGRVLGATSDTLESELVDLATGLPDAQGALNKYDNFAAGVLELVDVDPGDTLPGVVPWRPG